jgi:hypothetical protein
VKYYRTRASNNESIGLLYIDDIFKIDQDGKEWVYINGEWCPITLVDINTFKRLDHIYTVTDMSENEVNKLIMMEELKK